MDPLDWLARMNDHIPNPSQHRTLFYGSTRTACAVSVTLMVPTANSVALFRALPKAQLSIFPDAGHRALFQYHEQFVAGTLRFLAD